MLNGELHAEFDALLSGLRENFQPVGTFEECSAEMLGATRVSRITIIVLN